MFNLTTLFGSIGISLVTGALSLAATSGSPPPQDEEEVRPLEERVTRMTLDNGWSFLLLPRRETPVIAFETRVACGGVHEPPGRSGMANVLKNMLFKGSDRIGTRDWEAERVALREVDAAQAELLAAREIDDPQRLAKAEEAFRAARERAGSYLVPEEFSRIFEDAGGAATLNAFTTADETRFVVSLPSHQLELWCWMEAERFSRPVMREFCAEREALLEDRLSRVEANPTGLLSEAVLRTAYRTHPYGRAGGGRPEEIASFTRESAEVFFAEHYGARHMTTAIVGDFDPQAVQPLLERYFGSIPAGSDHPREFPPEPPQDGERRVEVESDAHPQLMIAWHVPPFAAPDTPAVEIAVRLLGYARSSRLERRLIRDEAIASSVIVSPAWGGNHDASLATVRAVPTSGVSLATLEAAIDEEISRLAREGPDPEELAGVKRVARADFLRSLRDDAAVAAGLIENEVKAGDWRAFFRTVEKLEAVDAEEVRRVLRAYFVPENRTVATLVPGEEKDR